MNLRHKNIKFTFEEEHNNKIAFLNISITWVGNELNELDISIFISKKTFSGVCLNFNSHLPSEYKKGLLQALVYRTYNICSDYTNLHQEIVYLKSVG